jgi:hypothetical protein
LFATARCSASNSTIPRTILYVSGRTGRVVHWTTATQRFWNWLGAIPHWLYFADLRSDVALWSEIVIWTSVLGTFLTARTLHRHQPAQVEVEGKGARLIAAGSTGTT